MTIRKATNFDIDSIFQIINHSAIAYKGNIPDDCWQEPYMSMEQLKLQIEQGVKFYCYLDGDEMIGVMGIQSVNNVNLIRHAYVVTRNRKSGVGSLLIDYLKSISDRPILIGTWKAASWAISFYSKHGFTEVSEEQKDELLKRYWSISERQIETSTVLVDGQYRETLLT